MKLKFLSLLVLSLTMGSPEAQVQLFEADMSGIVPHAGYKWSQAIQEYSVGLEYTIDGRTTLGFDYARPVKDTFDFDANLKSSTVNPYLIFEFIEPDNLKTFSFAIRADFVHESTTKDSPTPADTGKFNSFRRTWLGGGPVFALRIFSSEKLAMIPTAGYELFYVTYQKDELQGDLRGEFPEDQLLWHDLTGTCAFNYRFGEFNGIVFEPKVIVQLGKGRSTKDLVNVSAKFGYVRAF